MCGCVGGVYVVNCGDLRNRHWLIEEVVSTMVLDGNRLEVIDYEKVSRLIKFSINFRESTSVTTSTILARLIVQNPGLKNDYCRTAGVFSLSWGIHLVVAVDNGPVEFLERNDFYLCC